MPPRKKKAIRTVSKDSPSTRTRSRSSISTPSIVADVPDDSPAVDALPIVADYPMQTELKEAKVVDDEPTEIEEAKADEDRPAETEEAKVDEVRLDESKEVKVRPVEIEEGAGTKKRVVRKKVVRKKVMEAGPEVVGEAMAAEAKPKPVETDEVEAKPKLVETDEVEAKIPGSEGDAGRKEEVKVEVIPSELEETREAMNLEVTPVEKEQAVGNHAESEGIPVPNPNNTKPNIQVKGPVTFRVPNQGQGGSVNAVTLRSGTSTRDPTPSTLTHPRRRQNIDSESEGEEIIFDDSDS